MLSVVAVFSAISSSSQRRPRAIDATKVARFSERIGRACCGEPLTIRESTAWKASLPAVLGKTRGIPWRAFVFAMRNRDCTNLDEISILALSVTTKDFPHDMLLPRLTGSMLPRRCFPPHRKRQPRGTFALFSIGFPGRLRI
jgi:hypothetical protein